ncbi:NhaA family Na+:H+ antiporter [Cryobacterium mesophilum]|uniref:Na(+)/H(+) antiporter NhaA n=1 Tax=Terrimesophilobacter mesophilus TaxID=433647 RepID=A0A4R8V8X7_9MICO|nr:Na+/H+ antiporter NhaA [Terrimesophilobacter mesophilus]MBB5631843.1 NhaA family Na+:H+ antiporter [Terrimesophilobacter mesophilus]TFB78756.1 Na+/H+ antiporter NhaA [Terrimesophilobacter mesophilus]
MRILRSERIAAVLLVAAAALGLALANTPVGPGVAAVVGAPLPLPLIGLSLTTGGWVKDGLLAIFFLLAAIELRQELTRGELASARRALVPVVAAVGGVVVPAIIFLLIVREPELSSGWPIPTATDVAFALGVLAIVGRGLPGRIRALLLALAVIDDLIAIVIIGVFFTTGLQPLPLILAAPVILLFGWLSYRRSRGYLPALIVLGLAAWVLVALSGIHPTIAGVALGLVLAPRAAARTRRALEPVVNLAVLPIFAFVAALVVIPGVGLRDLSPVFWAILIALPLGKLVGITAGGVIASALAAHRSDRVPFGDLLVVAGLGGIGFTVSLLMNELAFGHLPVVAVEGTLAVLVASTIAAVIGAAIAWSRAAHYRRGRVSPAPER